ncbi:MAG: hypothetical protein F4Y47_21625 [Acidobacteriia bacterium]|nr:hypothetical protein [Terriglobia bacterium]MYK11499.1 hypothetical protein [Terriglobia bacterium]
MELYEKLAYAGLRERAGTIVRVCANLFGVRIAWVGLLLFAGCAGEVPPLPYIVESAASVDASAVELIVLRDEAGGIEAAIAPAKGGELSGLRVRHDGQWIETLQFARDYAPREGFAGKGPFLWPATGRNFPPDLEERRRGGEVFDAGAYEHGGVRREMPIHGFARDMPWTLEESSATQASARALLTLSDSPEAREMYPFGFRCSVEYLVTGGTLALRYVVRASAQNTEPMFFSLGNHITFLAPLLEGSDPNEMVLASPATLELLKTDYGIPTGETRPAGFAGGMRLGDYPPLVPTSLSGYPEMADPYIEYRDPGGLTIRISHHADRVPEQPVVLFNLWGDVRNGFFSPEPWVGLQNSLVQRQGLVFVGPGEEFAWTVQIAYESSS